MISEYQWVSWKLRVLSFSVGESGNPIFEYRFTEKPPKNPSLYTLLVINMVVVSVIISSELEGVERKDSHSRIQVQTCKLWLCNHYLFQLDK